MKQIVNADDKIYALNFVVDAFDDLCDYISLARQTGQITEGNLSKIKAATAFENVNQRYNEYIEIIFDQFAIYSKKYDIKNNENCIQVLKDFFIQLLPSYPFSRTSFILSNMNNVNSSGLSISIDKQNHSNDENKFINFINNPNFSFFCFSAQKFGFIVNKNAPWQLVADIESPAMKTYLQKYKLTKNNIFEICFYKSFYLEFENIKVLIGQFFKNISQKNLIEPIIIDNQTENKINSFKNQIFFISDYEWMKILLLIFSIERKTNINIEIENIKITNFLRTFDKYRLIEYIETRTKS